MSCSRCYPGASIVFNDPRRFGYMKVIARKGLEDEPLLRVLVLNRSAMNSTPTCWRALCASKKTSLKAALLDQRVVAGLGNIYVCEALFRAHLSPRRQAATLASKKGEPTDHARRLVAAIHAVLNQAIKAGGSSLRDHRQTSGELGYFQHSFQVYDREGEKCQTAMPGPRGDFNPERTIDLLAPEVPEMKLPTLRRQARHSIASSQRVTRMRARPFAFAEDERGKSLAHGVEANRGCRRVHRLACGSIFARGATCSTHPDGCCASR